MLWRGEEGAQDVFKIERATNNKAWSVIATLVAGRTSFSNLGLARNTTYNYRVCAINAAGNSIGKRVGTL